MTGSAIWVTVLAGCAACLGLKLVGAYVPRSWLSGERLSHILGLVTVALLAALLAVQAVGDGQGLAFDSRLAGVGAAGIALWLRAPFIVVVIVGAAVAAGLRALGFP
jgi:branched-subunit amino acid transport protein